MTSNYINKIFGFTWHIIFDIQTKVIKFKAFSFVQMVACAAQRFPVRTYTLWCQIVTLKLILRQSVTVYVIHVKIINMALTEEQDTSW